MVGMEAAAVSATLKLVGNKLAPLVIKKYSSIVGVEKDLQELQDLAQEINNHLEAAGERAIGDAPLLKKLKEAAYDVDDVVDEFQLKAEKYEADGDGGFVSRYLNISRLKHETLPEVISEIWSLQALHVTSSDIVKLPESIDKLFRCLKVATLPSSISSNKRLRVLRLGHTNLKGLPSSITALENLECLDLQCCSELEELPEGIGNLKKLVILNLCSVNMHQLESQISCLGYYEQP